MFYLYTLKDPETSDIRYVGYSKRPKSRLWEHIRDAKKGVKTHKSYWISNLLSKSLKPILDIVLDSAQIKKLIQLNKKSKKGFLFKKIIQSLSI